MNCRELNRNESIYCKQEFTIGMFSFSEVATGIKDVVFPKHHKFVLGPPSIYSDSLDMDILNSEDNNRYFVISDNINDLQGINKNYYIHPDRFDELFETKIDRAKRIIDGFR